MHYKNKESELNWKTTRHLLPNRLFSHTFLTNKAQVKGKLNLLSRPTSTVKFANIPC
jgi:hypothetical protein